MTAHSIYSDDPQIQAAIVAAIDNMLANDSSCATQIRQFIVKALPVRITVNNGVLCGVETWEPVGGGLMRRESDYTCYVCREPVADEEPHTFHAEGCPKRTERPCVPISEPCAELSGCGEDCHETCCPTCTGQASDRDAIVLTDLGEQGLAMADRERADRWVP